MYTMLFTIGVVCVVLIVIAFAALRLAGAIRDWIGYDEE